MYNAYFRLFPWEALPTRAVGLDVGCGSGRWARFVAPRVETLHCVDASQEALEVARRNLTAHSNCKFHLASVDEIPLRDNSVDFGYSLGVLHHVPHTAEALRACVRKLKPGAPFLVYLYYALDNKPWWYSAVWRVTDLARRTVARMPFPLRLAFSQTMALLVYWPLARLACVAERLGAPVSNLPLAFYRHRSLYVMRTDALDRFGTSLEQRFSRREMAQMLEGANLDRVQFSDTPPYWCAIGYKRRTASIDGLQSRG
jgi:SAM-dependent methyltransferase